MSTPNQVIYSPPIIQGQTVVRWSFTDVYQRGPAPYTYTFNINPDQGGSPEITKNFGYNVNVGPNHVNIVQEGQFTTPTLSFQGTILTQDHYEAMEVWMDRRVVIDLVDDLQRTFRGLFSKFSPSRERRGANFWYHTYTAEFLVLGYKQASGTVVYGNFF